jgi:hypothetical protein
VAAAATESLQALADLVDKQDARLSDLRKQSSAKEIAFKQLQTQVRATPRDNPRYEEMQKLFSDALTDYNNTHERANFAEEDVARSKGLLNQAQLSVASAPANIATLTTHLISTAVTRVGILVIAVLLVQILVGLYRYNARIASTYLAEADSLVLLDVDAEKLATLIKAMKPNIGLTRVRQHCRKKR